MVSVYVPALTRGMETKPVESMSAQYWYALLSCTLSWKLCPLSVRIAMGLEAPEGRETLALKVPRPDVGTRLGTCAEMVS